MKSDAPFYPNDIDLPSTFTVYLVSFCFDGCNLIVYIIGLGCFGLRYVTSTVFDLQVLHTNIDGFGAACSIDLISSVILVVLLYV